MNIAKIVRITPDGNPFTTVNGEEWRPINVPGHPELAAVYSVSDRGRVMRMVDGHRTLAGRFLKPGRKSGGYLGVEFNLNCIPTTLTVHRLVSLAFIPNPENKPQVNHKNGDKTDNRVENLEWVTSAENVQHAYDTLGHLAARGENHGHAKLIPSDIKEIRAWWKTGDVSKAALACAWEVHRITIFDIIEGRTWSHI